MDPARIKAVLHRVRPFLQAEGGDIELLRVTGNKARVRLTGKCAGCPSAHLTLHVGVEMAIKEEVPELDELIVGVPPRKKRTAWSEASLSPSGFATTSSGSSTRSRRTGREPFSTDSVVVGTSRRMRGVFDFVRVIANDESTVLITGESGTGKEMIANLIHHSSPRRHRPFVAVSCAILSETLIESELFGHERGAFTNAIRERPGRFELAEGGTLFLDDIDDVPLTMQVKLLRVLQTRTVERVGAVRSIPIDVRVLTGSKRDLGQLVAAGTFREDLFYRLNVIPIQLPPLRERLEDIPTLVHHFFRRYFRARGKDPKPVSPTVLEAFRRYSWPGNVRELENACERIAQTCICDSLMSGCVPASVFFQKTASAEARVASEVEHPAGLSLEDRIRQVEINLIRWALRESNGNKSKAAVLLKVKRSTLGDRIKKLGLGNREGAVLDVPPAAAPPTWGG
jgi:transcriptional regulator with PAS, ATPase and Fis domain/Fe-S cluster biogenesis protein NfuA